MLVSGVPGSGHGRCYISNWDSFLERSKERFILVFKLLMAKVFEYYIPQEISPMPVSPSIGIVLGKVDGDEFPIMFQDKLMQEISIGILPSRSKACTESNQAKLNEDHSSLR